LSVYDKRGFGLEKALVVRSIIMVFVVKKTLLLLSLSNNSELFLFLIEVLELIVFA
jgi:hypothetical protein